MKSAPIPSIVLALLVVAFAVDLYLSTPQIPGEMATHFDASGHPDGWMTRSGHLGFMMCIGLGTPLLLAGLCYFIRNIPSSAINIPHRDYWLAPERRDETDRRLIAHLLWLPCLMILFFAAVHHLILAANTSVPPHLPSSGMIAAIGGILAGLAIWVIALYRMFAKPA